MMLVALFVIAVGFFVDATVLIIMLTPIFLPLVRDLGADPVHFGMVFIIAATIGNFTPPVGAAMYAVCSILRCPIGEYSRELLPLFAAGDPGDPPAGLRPGAGAVRAQSHLRALAKPGDLQGPDRSGPRLRELRAAGADQPRGCLGGRSVLKRREPGLLERMTLRPMTRLHRTRAAAKEPGVSPWESGGRCWDRTSDPYDVNVVLSR